MSRDELCSKIDNVIREMNFEGSVISCDRYGSGHINDTFLVKSKLSNGKEKKYVLQRMNHEIFKNTKELMENVYGVTAFIRNKVIENGGDPDRETMNIVKTKSSQLYFKDELGCFWRAYQFIEDAICYDQVEKPEDFYESAISFGHFQNLLADYDAKKLNETIKDFHETTVRYQTLMDAVEKDSCNRKEGVKEEIQFFIDRKEEMKIALTMLKKGELPLRVTHNDTKLNNIMIDNQTRKGICVIDLDTVMPGLSMNDFGDSIRFGANIAAEDEMDLSKVALDLNLFELYTKGFLEGCNGSLTENEIKMLPFGAKLMTLECGMRFLTDYLQGDVYFRIHREGQNLDRARTQIELVKDMEVKWDKMLDIVEKYC